MTTKRSDDLEMMKQLLFRDHFIIVDTETTGFSTKEPYPDELTEIGAIKVIANEVVDSFDELIKPQLHELDKLPATRVTGITDEMVKNCDGYIKVLKRFHEFCEGPYVLIMHNATFDLGMLKLWGGKMRLNFDQPYIDTLKLSRAVLNKIELQEKQRSSKASYKLQDLAHAFNIPDPSHHRASNDALVTWKLVQVLRQEILKKEPYYQNLLKASPSQTPYPPQQELGKDQARISSLSYSALPLSSPSQAPHITSLATWQRGPHYRLYVELRTSPPQNSGITPVSSGITPVSTVFYDFVKGQWGIKELMFEVDFDWLERYLLGYYGLARFDRDAYGVCKAKGNWRMRQELKEEPFPEKLEKGKDIPSDWTADLEVTLEDLDKPFPLHPF